MMSKEKIGTQKRSVSASASENVDVLKVKEYLREVRTKQRYAQVLCERAQRYRDMAMRATGRVSAVRFGGTSRRSKVEDNVLAMMDVEKELRDRMKELLEDTRRVEKMISLMTDERYHAVLQLRYLCGLSWEEVANRLHFTVRWVHKLHGEGLKQLAQGWTPRGH